MSVTLVNSHVLIPDLPEWGESVGFQRHWQAEVGRALTGGEHRVAMRQRPRLDLSWSLVPFDVSDQAGLHARMRAAVKSGYAAVPYWGRGIRLSQGSGDTIVLAGDAWSFLEVDDYVLIRSLNPSSPEEFEVVQIATAVSTTEFNLTTDLTLSWTSLDYVWPLLFGAFTCGPLSHRSDWHTPVQCTLRTLVSRPIADPIDLCAIEDPNGVYVVSGDTFDCYDADYEGPFTAGANWIGNTTGTELSDVGLDTFATYTEGISTGLNGGVGFANGTTLEEQTKTNLDGFSDYGVGDPPADGGFAFAGTTTITDLTT